METMIILWSNRLFLTRFESCWTLLTRVGLVLTRDDSCWLVLIRVDLCWYSCIRKDLISFFFQNTSILLIEFSWIRFSNKNLKTLHRQFYWDNWNGVRKNAPRKNAPRKILTRFLLLLTLPYSCSFSNFL